VSSEEGVASELQSDRDVHQAGTPGFEDTPEPAPVSV